MSRDTSACSFIWQITAPICCRPGWNWKRYPNRLRPTYLEILHGDSVCPLLISRGR